MLTCWKSSCSTTQLSLFAAGGGLQMSQSDSGVLDKLAVNSPRPAAVINKFLDVHVPKEALGAHKASHGNAAALNPW